MAFAEHVIGFDVPFTVVKFGNNLIKGIDGIRILPAQIKSHAALIPGLLDAVVIREKIDEPLVFIYGA